MGPPWYPFRNQTFIISTPPSDTDIMQPNMQKYQLTKDEMYALIDRAKMAVISTIGEDGYPYGTDRKSVV